MLSHRTPRRTSGGFTLVELLVVIAIIGILVALVLPAVNAAREAAALTNCQNQVKQIATAMTNYETGKGKYPGYVQPMKRSPQPGDTGTRYVRINAPSGGVGPQTFETTFARNESFISWAAMILPQMDQQPQYDQMVDGAFGLSPITTIGGLICPRDNELAGLDTPGLTYVINTGAWDYNASGLYLDPAVVNQGDTIANGVAHNLTRSSRPVSTSLSGINDGATYTLLFGENVHKNTANQPYAWMGVGDGLPEEQRLGMVWVVNTTPASGTGLGLQYPIDKSAPGANTGFYELETPAYARPTSQHPGGVVVVAMVGGNVRTLTPSINYNVYQQLLTPKGRDCVDPTDHTNTLGAINVFRTLPPVGDNDLGI